MALETGGASVAVLLIVHAVVKKGAAAEAELPRWGRHEEKQELAVSRRRPSLLHSTGTLRIAGWIKGIWRSPWLDHKSFAEFGATLQC